MVFIPILIFLLYAYSFLKIKFIALSKNNPLEQKISLIVAAKNEGHNLEALIESILSQNYSEKNFELIIIDDHSNDSTYAIAQELVKNINNFHIIKSTNKVYHGKRGALQTGIDNSIYENIVITDADCKANKGFLKSYSNKFNDNFDFIFGVAPLLQKNTFSNKLACFDNLWVHILSFSFSNIGLPYSAAARSFGFRKEAFKKIKGYENASDTISGDDDLLLREAVKKNLTIGTIIDPAAFVYTDSKNSLNEFIRQKSRHTTTSNYYSRKIKIMLGFWHLLNLIMLFSVFLSPLSTDYFGLFAFKMLGDIFIVKLLMSRFSYKFTVVDILVYQFFYEVFLVVNYINSFFSKNKW